MGVRVDERRQERHLAEIDRAASTARRAPADADMAAIERDPPVAMAVAIGRIQAARNDMRMQEGGRSASARPTPRAHACITVVTATASYVAAARRLARRVRAA